MKQGMLLLGVDGGGTRCRARLCTPSGLKLGEAVAGPANIRLGLIESLRSVRDVAKQCLQQAGLEDSDISRITACLALAGASEPLDLAAARANEQPFGRTMFTTDARAACVGAHGGGPGGIIIVGTGTIGWAEQDGQSIRVGGWGFPVSDEGSGAWLGCEALRRVLWAYDGLLPWTDLLTTLFERFDRNPHKIVRFTSKAFPRDFGTLAPLVLAHANQRDPIGVTLVQRAACHVDAYATRLIACGVLKLALVGGLGAAMADWVSVDTRRHLVAPKGDAVDGALQLARASAGAVAA